MDILPCSFCFYQYWGISSYYTFAAWKIDLHYFYFSLFFPKVTIANLPNFCFSWVLTNRLLFLLKKNGVFFISKMKRGKKLKLDPQAVTVIYRFKFPNQNYLSTELISYLLLLLLSWIWAGQILERPDNILKRS